MKNKDIELVGTQNILDFLSNMAIYSTALSELDKEYDVESLYLLYFTCHLSLANDCLNKISNTFFIELHRQYRERITETWDALRIVMAFLSTIEVERVKYFIETVMINTASRIFKDQIKSIDSLIRDKEFFEQNI